MLDILEQITQDKRQQVSAQIAQTSLKSIREQAIAQPATRGFEAALRHASQNKRFPVIAEIKRKSPSKGVLCDPFDVVAIAKAYEQNGAACLSVLTDEPYFGGTADDLITARNTCNLPILRKDFMLCDWQIYESRAYGADAILLIVAILDKKTIAELAQIAISLGMSILIEVHNQAQMDIALSIPDGMIGINNRNLKTFQTDLQTTVQLLPQAHAKHRFVISESGISTRSDIKQMQNAGADAFLIGESVVNNPICGLQNLFIE